MITKEEIQQKAFQSKLSTSQIEKDYVLGWFLAGISEHPELSKSWVFKGGTCLRKIYIKDYRYSEDLDYTAIDKSLFSMKTVHKQINEVCLWVAKNSGIEVNNSRSKFDDLHNPTGQNIIQGRVFYRGPVSPSSPSQWPRIKFDITSDEIITTIPEQFEIMHPYSDQENIKCLVNTYSIYDLFSEKIRALFERTRPRDLYDVVEMSKRFLDLDHGLLKTCLSKKCDFKGIVSLRIEYLKLDACKAGWRDQLSHQLENLPNFDYYLNEFIEFYNFTDLKGCLDR